MSKLAHGGARWPATDHAIAQAMMIIAPPPDQNAECRELLEDRYSQLVMSSVNRYWSGRRNTKQSKAAARRLGKALRLVLHTWNAVKDDLYTSRSHIAITEIEKWIERCDKDEHAPAPRRALAQPEKLAVACLGVDLLRRYGGKVTVTPRGQLNQIVGVLLGNPGGNYSWVCRKARAQRGAK